MTEKIVIENLKIKQLLERYKTFWALDHVSALAGWDLSTYMPEAGAAGRGEALAKISSLSQQLFLDKSFLFLLDEAGKQKLNDYEKAIIRKLEKVKKYYVKLPASFIEDLVKTTNESHVVWQKAKKQSNFSLFAPHLQKIVELNKKKAAYLGHKKHPYDALLDEFEEGLTTEQVEDYFKQLTPALINLLKKILSSKHYKKENPIQKIEYDEKKMKELNDLILKELNPSGEGLRVDISAHPFSTLIGPGDARITTRYAKTDFNESFGSTIHEFGHALYSMQSAKELDYTPLSGGSSMIIHESQSRFWENHVGRSKPFINKFLPEFKKLNPELKGKSIDEVHEYINHLSPGLIRVGADELTYHFHIIIRFEIEKALIDGTLLAKDVEKAWSEKYKQYLSVYPKKDSEGVLQDVHWSYGNIGYFPTYSMGTALAAIWEQALEKDLGKLDKLISSDKGIDKIKAWLKQNIHCYGSTYLYDELVKKSANQSFSPQPLLKYLENKYLSLYN